MKRLLTLLALAAQAFAQPDQTAEKAGVSAEIGEAGNKIVIEAHGVKPKAPLFYTADVNLEARFSLVKISEKATVNFQVLQGEAETLSLEIFGDAKVTEVVGEKVAHWSVRKDGEKRFLDFTPVEPKELRQMMAIVLLERDELTLPLRAHVSTFGPASSTGFTARYTLKNQDGVSHKILNAEGAMPLADDHRLAATQAAVLRVALFRTASQPSPIEFTQARLSGVLSAAGTSATFRLQGVARVTGEKEQVFEALRGNAAPISEEEKLSLVYDAKNRPAYQLKFEEAGLYPVDLEFVAPVRIDKKTGWRSFEFSVPGGAVVPIELSGIAESSQFDLSREVAPVWQGQVWQGFLPASGACALAWQPKRQSGDGKLFFTSEAKTDVGVGAGLLKQVTELKVKPLQGSLTSLKLTMAGAGEVLAVEGKNVLSWTVEAKSLEIVLSRAVKQEASFLIRSQSALEVLPVKVEPLRLTPEGVVRHSGFLRVYNQGAVRLEVMKTSGLTQLSPDQYPEAAALPENLRQVFFYRFPSSQRSYSVSAERVKPEVNLSQILVYEMTETDRVIRADLELDIREAGVREWELQAPGDYSVVSVTGVDVADYVASQPEKGRRRIKVIFGNEVTGRRLVKLHLEKNEAAQSGTWALPGFNYPGVKSVRGELGVSSVAGFRIHPGKVEGLVDIPLVHFQKNNAKMQQAYRIRSEQWSASIRVEALSQNVQADVFHLYSLKERSAYVSVLIVTGAPVHEWKLTLPPGAENYHVDGQDVRDSRLNEGLLTVPLHRPVMGTYQLLVTYEQKAEEHLSMGELMPVGAQGERGFIQVVSPGQVELSDEARSENFVKLDPLELPAEYRLMSHAPSLAAWQYSSRPVKLSAGVTWFERGEMARQVVEYAELSSRVARDGGVVTEIIYDVRSRGDRTLHLRVPEGVKLREVSVNGESVTIRKAGDERLIPLPEDVNPNKPVRVELRASSQVSSDRVIVSVPTVIDTTQLMTRWTVKADSGHHLESINSGRLELLTEDSRVNGFDWIAENALIPFALILVFLVLGWRMAWFGESWGGILGAILLLATALGSFYLSSDGMNQRVPVYDVLEYAAPVIAPNVDLVVAVSHQDVEFSWGSGLGFVLSLVGLVVLVVGLRNESRPAWLILPGGIALAVGLLLFGGGAGAFFFALGIVISVLLVRAVFGRKDDWGDLFRKTPPATALLVGFALLSFGPEVEAKSKGPRWPAASVLHEKWELDGGRVKAQATMKIHGEAGEKFLLLHAPGVLTDFDGPGVKVLNEKTNYFVVPIEDGSHEFRFSYEAPAGDPSKGLSVLTSIATVRSLEVHYEAAGWGIHSPAAVRHEVISPAQGSAAKIWLGPSLDTKVILSPRTRDVAAEETRFYAEVENLFVPGPGVIDGRHRVNIRPSQGQVKELSITVPKGFTVSDVRSSLVGPWRFDPEARVLRLELSPAQSGPFALLVETQRSLAALPAQAEIEPIRISGTSGEVGMVALAFGKEAQLDRDEPKGFSLVNITDFGNAMLPRGANGIPKITVQKVYRYAKAPASLKMTVAPVAAEVRVTSKQKLSIGDERTVLGVDFTAAITRAGVFRLSFPLPTGFEVESLTGGALNHWVEVEEDKKRYVVMNLNGKTLGEQTFHLVLAGASPTPPAKDWKVPKFSLREADRDSGQLVVIPGRGIQLRAASRKDVSALDPRSVGGHQAGSLAYRLLQKSWSVGLAIDQLQPSISVRQLQDVELREGHSQTRVDLRIQVDHASVRKLTVNLPGLSEVDAQTVRASGNEVRDIVRQEGDLWELQFKRRVIGESVVRIEFGQNDQSENVKIRGISVEEARQQESYLALRPGARLELSVVDSSQLKSVDWSGVPKKLLQLDRSGAPSAFLRSMAKDPAVTVSLKRHSVASASKIRVKSGRLFTIVSSTGELMNQADLSLEMIQRGSLELSLPEGSRLFGVFVNEESAMVVKKGNGYLFKVVGDAGGREAKVRIYYATTLQEGSLSDLALSAFSIGEPLENVEWIVNVPAGYQLSDSEGDLDVVNTVDGEQVTRERYLQLVRSRNSKREKEALGRLGKVSDFLVGGFNGKAAITLEQVYNKQSLDAASNEDARVQFENLVTQQAVVGLNTRLQRLYLDNASSLGAAQKNDQLEVAANQNPVFAGNLNYRQDDFSNVTVGNSVEVNRAINTIANKWVRHQRVTEPVPQMLDPVIPEPGNTIVFQREIQVSGDEALKLNLKLKKSGSQSGTFQKLLVLLLLMGVVAFCATRKNASIVHDDE